MRKPIHGLGLGLVLLASAAFAGPQETKQGTIPTLQAAKDQYPALAPRIQKAIEDIQDSLLDGRDRGDCDRDEGDDPEVGRSLFLLSDVLDPERGGRVFNKEKQAADKLLEVIRDRKTPAAAKPVLQGVANSLVEADRLLARKALDDARAFLGGRADSNRDLQKGEASYAQAQALSQQGKSAQAIDKYKEAWEEGEDLAAPHLALKFTKDLGNLLSHANRRLDRLPSSGHAGDKKLKALADFIALRAGQIQCALERGEQKLAQRLGLPLAEVHAQVVSTIRLYGGEALEIRLASTVARLKDLAGQPQPPRTLAALNRAIAALTGVGAIVDRTAPIISGLLPAEGGVVGASPVLSAAFEDNLSGVDVVSVAVVLDGADVTAQAHPTAAGFSFTPSSPLAEGAHTLSVSIADRAGNPATATRHFSVAIQAPRITAFVPDNGAYVRLRRPAISVAYSAGGGVDTASVHLLLDGVDVTTQAAVTATGVGFTPASDLSEAQHTVSITLADLAGNTASGQVSWTVDATAPLIADLQPAEGGYTGLRPAMSAVFSDSPSGIDPTTIVITLDGQNVTAQATVTASGFSFTPAADLSGGQHTLTVSVSDRAGNPVTASSHFTVDDQPPQIQSFTPANGSFIQQLRPAVNVAYSDGLSGVDTASVHLTLDGTDVTAHAQVTATGVSFTPTQDLAEGDHTVSLSARDRAGNPASAQATWTLDASAPQVVALVPAQGAYTRVRRPTLSASYSDTGSGIDTAGVHLTLDGSDVTSQATVTATGISFTSASDLSEGQHTVAVSVRDRAGNPASNQATWTLDATAPLIADLLPAEGSFTAARPAVSAAFSDPLSGVDVPSVHVVLDGQDVTAQATVTETGFSFTPSAPLSGGSHALEVSLADKAGNPATASTHFNVDGVPPQVSALTPADGVFLSNPRPACSGSFADAGSGIDPATARILLDGQDVTSQAQVSAAGFSFIPGQPLPDGEHTLEAAVSDKVANRTTATSRFVLDAVPPQISQITPAEGSYGNNPRPTLSAAFSDDRSGIDAASARVLLDGQDVTSQAQPTITGFSFAPSSGLQDGERLLEVRVADRAANPAQASSRFRVDTVPPGILDLAPADGSFTRDATPECSATFSDAGSGVDAASVRVTLDGTDVTSQAQPTASGFRFSPSDLLVEGEHVLAVSLADQAGNPASASTRFTVDTAAPLITAVTPADAGFGNNARPVLSASFSDALSGVDSASARILLDSQDVTAQATVTASGFSFTPGTPLQDGEHALEISVADRAGNPAGASSRFVIDTAAPQISALSPADASWGNNPRPTLSAALSDSLSGIDATSARISLDGTDVTSQAQVSAEGLSFTPGTPLSDGEHVLVVSVSDRATNPASASSRFVVDTVLPEVRDLSAPDGSATNDPRKALSGHFLDDRSGIEVSLARITLDGVDVTAQAQVSATGFSFVPGSALEEGEHVLVATVLDRAGNSFTITNRFLVDLHAPEISALAPADGAFVAAASPTLSATFSDGLSGTDLASVHVVLDGVDVTSQANATASGFSFTPAALGETEHVLAVSLADRAGNPASASSRFSVDLHAPEISALAPPDGTFLNTARPAISASYSDGLSGIDTGNVRLTVDGVDVTAQTTVTASGVSFTPASDLSEAQHTVAISLSDRAGHPATAQAAWTLDATAPQVANLIPANGTTVDQARPPMSGTFSDNLSGVATASVRIHLDQADVTAQAQVTELGFSFTPSQDLSQAQHTLLVDLADRAGNPAIASTTFTVGGAPDVLLVDDDGGSTLESFFVQALNARNITFQRHDVSVSGPPSVVLLSQFKRVIWTTGETYFPALNPVELDVLHQYLDAGGNLFLSSEGFAVDVAFGGQPDAVAFAHNYLHVASFAGDFFGASTAAGEAGDPIGDGLSLNLSNPVLFNFTDSMVPDEQAAGIFRNDFGELIGSRYPGGDSDTWRAVYTSFPFEAIDPNAAHPNTQAEVLSRILDFLNPRFLVTQILPADGQAGIGTNAKVHLRFSAKVEAGTVTTDSIFLSLPGGAHVPAIPFLDPTTNIVSILPLGDLPADTQIGVTVTTGVTDQRGRALAAEFHASFTTGVTEDHLAPSAPQGLQADPDTTRGDKITLTWVPNAEADVFGYEILRKLPTEGDFTQIGFVMHPVARFVDRNATPGVDHTYVLKAMDVALNASVASVAVHATPLDTTPPSFQITSHFNFQLVNQTPLVLSGTIDDPHARITVLGVVGEETVNGATFTTPPVPLIDGRNDLTVIATDPFNNSSQQSITLFLDTIPPAAQITAPRAGARVSGDSVVVLGTATDVNFSIYFLEWGAGPNPSSFTQISQGYYQTAGQILGTWNTFGVPEGVVTLRLRVQDMAGNQSLATVPVVVDNLLDLPQVTSLTDGLTMQDSTPLVYGHAAAGARIIVYVDGVEVASTFANLRGDFLVELPILPDGSHAITTRMEVGGQMSPLSAPIHITIDTSAPSPDGFALWSNPQDGAPSDGSLITEADGRWSLVGLSVLDDDFHAPTLDPKWSRLRPPQAGFSTASGELAVTMDPYENLEDLNTAPLFLQTSPAADFECSVKVRTPVLNAFFEQAGLVFYENDDNYVMIAKAFIGNRPMLYTAVELDGILRFTNTVVYEADTVFLRLRRIGHNHILEYSADRENWAVLDQITADIHTELGVTAFSDGSSTATVFFDDFKIIDSIPTSFPASSPEVLFEQRDAGSPRLWRLSDFTFSQTGTGTPHFQYAVDQAGSSFNGTWLTVAELMAQPNPTSQWLRLKARLDSDGTQALSIDDLRVPNLRTGGDTIAPSAPTSVTTQSLDGSVVLTWQPSGAQDVAGYRITRTSSTGEVVVFFVPASATSFTDPTVQNGTSYTYRIEAVDSSGNASTPSQGSTANPQDDTTMPVLVAQVSPMDMLPEGTKITRTSLPSFRVEANDPESGLNHDLMSITLNGADVTSQFIVTAQTPTSTTRTFTPSFQNRLQDGPNGFQVTSVNNRGLVRQESVSFIVDTMGPQFQGPPDNARFFVNDEGAAISFLVTDTGVGVDPSDNSLRITLNSRDVTDLFQVVQEGSGVRVSANLTKQALQNKGVTLGQRSFFGSILDRAGNTGARFTFLTLTEIPQWLTASIAEHDIYHTLFSAESYTVEGARSLIESLTINAGATYRNPDFGIPWRKQDLLTAANAGSDWIPSGSLQSKLDQMASVINFLHWVNSGEPGPERSIFTIGFDFTAPNLGAAFAVVPRDWGLVVHDVDYEEQINHNVPFPYSQVFRSLDLGIDVTSQHRGEVYPGLARCFFRGNLQSFSSTGLEAQAAKLTVRGTPPGGNSGNPGQMVRVVRNRNDGTVPSERGFYPEEEEGTLTAKFTFLQGAANETLFSFPLNAFKLPAPQSGVVAGTTEVPLDLFQDSNGDPFRQNTDYRLRIAMADEGVPDAPIRVDQLVTNYATFRPWCEFKQGFNSTSFGFIFRVPFPRIDFNGDWLGLESDDVYVVHADNPVLDLSVELVESDSGDVGLIFGSVKDGTDVTWEIVNDDGSATLDSQQTTTTFGITQNRLRLVVDPGSGRVPDSTKTYLVRASRQDNTGRVFSTTSPTIVVAPGKPDQTKTQLTIQKTPDRVPADGVSTAAVSITVKDQFGNPIPDTDVRWTLRQGEGRLYIDPADLGPIQDAQKDDTLNTFAALTRETPAGFSKVTLEAPADIPAGSTFTDQVIEANVSGEFTLTIPVESFGLQLSFNPSRRHLTVCSEEEATINLLATDAKTGAGVPLNPKAEVVWVSGPGLIETAGRGFGNTVSALVQEGGDSSTLITGLHGKNQKSGPAFVAAFVGNNRVLDENFVFDLPPEWDQVGQTEKRPLRVDTTVPVIAGDVQADTVIPITQADGTQENFTALASAPVTVVGEPNETVVLSLTNNRKPVLKYDMNEIVEVQQGGQTVQTLVDLAGGHTGTLHGPVLREGFAAAGGASLDFTAGDQTVSTPDAADLRVTNALKVEMMVAGVNGNSAPGTLLGKGTDYRVSILGDGTSRATVQVNTTAGTFSATASTRLTGVRNGFDLVVAELKDGLLTLTINEDTTGQGQAACPGTVLASAADLVLGGGFVGQLDAVTLYNGDPALALTGFPGGAESIQLQLDGAGNASTTVFSMGRLHSETNLTATIRLVSQYADGTRGRVIDCTQYQVDLAAYNSKVVVRVENFIKAFGGGPTVGASIRNIVRDATPLLGDTWQLSSEFSKWRSGGDVSAVNITLSTLGLAVDAGGVARTFKNGFRALEGLLVAGQQTRRYAVRQVRLAGEHIASKLLRENTSVTEAELRRLGVTGVDDVIKESGEALEAVNNMAPASRSVFTGAAEDSLARGSGASEIAQDLLHAGGIPSATNILNHLAEDAAKAERMILIRSELSKSGSVSFRRALSGLVEAEREQVFRNLAEASTGGVPTEFLTRVANDGTNLFKDNPQGLLRATRLLKDNPATFGRLASQALYDELKKTVLQTSGKKAMSFKTYQKKTYEALAILAKRETAGGGLLTEITHGAVENGNHLLSPEQIIQGVHFAAIGTKDTGRKFAQLALDELGDGHAAEFFHLMGKASTGGPNQKVVQGLQGLVRVNATNVANGVTPAYQTLLFIENNAGGLVNFAGDLARNQATLSAKKSVLRAGVDLMNTADERLIDAGRFLAYEFKSGGARLNESQIVRHFVNNVLSTQGGTPNPGRLRFVFNELSDAALDGEVQKVIRALENPRNFADFPSGDTVRPQLLTDLLASHGGSLDAASIRAMFTRLNLSLP